MGSKRCTILTHPSPTRYPEQKGRLLRVKKWAPKVLSLWIYDMAFLEKEIG